MTKEELNNGEELYYIYTLLRKLKLATTTSKRKSTLDATLFPRRFLLKLLDEKFKGLFELANSLVESLFKRLLGKTKETNELLVQHPRTPFTTRCLELDEYFHHCLYDLHDFILKLDWYEPSIIELTIEDSNYVKSKLKFIEGFISFSEKINEKHVETLRRTKKVKIHIDSPNNSISLKQSTLSASSIKSNLSSGPSLESLSRKRRIRFKDSLAEDAMKIKRRRDLKESQSILALDLLIYSLELFINVMYDKMLETKTDFDDVLILLIGSKQRIRTARLESLAKQFKSSNDIYLTVLEHLVDLRRIYLSDFLLGIISAKDSDRLLRVYKQPHIRIFIEKVCLQVEQKIVAKLATKNVQLLIDLIIHEVNLPPPELDSETANKSKEEVVRSRENYFNFLTSWLNVDYTVFGFVDSNRKGSSNSVMPQIANKEDYDKKESTLATSSGRFKSSSRILSQMDNLNEFMIDLMQEISNRTHSSQQLKCFLDLIQVGFERAFDEISTHLTQQLLESKSKELNWSITKDEHEDVENIMRNLDLISAKIRCLKSIHIFSSIDKLIKGIAAIHKLELSHHSLETKLTEFADTCAQHTGSSYIS